MNANLYLRSFPNPPTRCATLLELLQCVTGLILCLVILVASAVFMAVDVEFPDVDFGTFLAIPTWQMFNYILNTAIAVAAVLISGNLLALYSSVQQLLLLPSSHSRGRMPASALAKPGLLTAYTLIGTSYPLVLVSIAVALVPILSAIAAFLIDFKLTIHEINICATGQNIRTLFDTIDSMYAWYQMNGTALGEWTALSDLVLLMAATRLPYMSSPFLPHDFLSNSMNAATSDGWNSSIQFGGTTFLGDSTYGFSPAPRVMWQGRTSLPPGILDPVVTKLFPASTIRVERIAPGQTSAFSCDSLPFANSSRLISLLLPIGTSSFDNVTLYTISTQGPCFTRNSTFMFDASGVLPASAQFDIQACSTETALHIQLVVTSPVGLDTTSSYSVEAYNCSSAVLEGTTRGVQSSQNTILVYPPASDVQEVSAVALRRYAAHLNVYFGLATYPITNSSTAPSSASLRTQGPWTTPLLHNWAATPTGPIQFPEGLLPPPPKRALAPMAPSYWPGAVFLPAYADALVTGFGTYFATLFSAARPLSGLASGGSCASRDVLVKQVVRLGAPPKIGVPLLLIPLVVLVAHGVLLALYARQLPALQPDDCVDMLRKVEVTTGKAVMVAELCATWGEETVALLDMSCSSEGAARDSKPDPQDVLGIHVAPSV